MKILHTADWHLGASLGNFRRYDEFEQMLAFLIGLIRKEQIRCVIIAGDIFDVPIPPNRAVELYYRFLTDCAEAGVRFCIITAGNHDSASFIEAPGELLKRLHVYVTGFFNREDPAAHLIDLDGEAVVAAVPFLHERDIRSAVSGETFDEQQEALKLGIIETYRKIAAAAKEHYPDLPLIATGHFWAVPAGERERFVGCSSAVPLADFPEEIGYLALGHIHGCYPVIPHCHYSGSILQMNFDEAAHEKSVLILDSADLAAGPRAVPLPVFRKMRTVSGTLEEIFGILEELKSEKIWLRIENTGPFEANLRTMLLDRIKNTGLELISCSNREPNPAIIRRSVTTEKLSELKPETVFRRLLNAREIPEEEQTDLLDAFRIAEEAVRAAQREGNAQ